MRAFVAEMGFALPMRHKLPQVLPDKMPPGGKRMARLSDWLPFVTRPRAFGCWLDRSRAADGGCGGGADASAFSAPQRRLLPASPDRHALLIPPPKKFLPVLLCRHSEMGRTASSWDEDGQGGR